MARAAKKKISKPDFEGSLQRLEEIVSEIESGELPLERAIELFEEGVGLGRQCGKTLDEAEERITLLLEKSDGTLEERAFNEAEDEGDDEPTS